jgi:hypothetical protein
LTNERRDVIASSANQRDDTSAVPINLNSAVSPLLYHGLVLISVKYKCIAGYHLCTGTSREEVQKTRGTGNKASDNDVDYEVLE